MNDQDPKAAQVPDEYRSFLIANQAKPEAIDWRHIANEWADAACNGVQWLRNVQEGISTPADGLAEMTENFARIRALAAAQPPRSPHEHTDS